MSRWTNKDNIFFLYFTSKFKIRAIDISIKEVYTPFPVHGLDHALGLKETRMAITAFIYGCLGLAFGGLLIYYIMISGVGKSWPMNIGGKPNWTYPNRKQW